MITKLCLFLALAASVTTVSAETVHHVTPRAIDRTVQPRDILNEEIVISNPFPHRLQVYATVNELVVNEQGDILDFVSNVAADRSKTITSWIQITQGLILIEPGATATVPLRIAIPADVEPSEYHALIGFGTGRNRPIAEAAVFSGSAPGTLVRIEVPASTIVQTDLDTLSVNRFVFDTEQDVVRYVVTNTTRTPITPGGEIIVYNNRGREIGSIPINPEELELAVGEMHEFTSALTGLTLIGRYEVKLSLSNANPGLAAAVYDSTSIYYIPWWQLALGLLLTIILASYVYSRHRKTPVRYSVTTVDESLPLHVYQGESDAVDHDINLKQ